MTDVMLVLLIVFLITIPVVNHRIPVTLPKVRLRADGHEAGKRLAERSRAVPAVPARSIGSCKKVNQKQLLDMAVKKLEDQIKAVGGVQNINEDNMPEAHIRGDINTPVQVHRCGHPDDAGSWVPARRLHLATGRRSGSAAVGAFRYVDANH